MIFYRDVSFYIDLDFKIQLIFIIKYFLIRLFLELLWNLLLIVCYFLIIGYFIGCGEKDMCRLLLLDLVFKDFYYRNKCFKNYGIMIKNMIYLQEF